MATQTPATAKIEKWPRIRALCFTNIWLPDPGLKKTQNPAGVHPGSMVTSGVAACSPPKLV